MSKNCIRKKAKLEHKKIDIETHIVTKQYLAGIAEVFINLIKNQPNYEFEIHLGKMSTEKNSFVSGVEEKFFNSLLESIESKQTKINNEWQNETIYYFPDKIRGLLQDKLPIQFEKSERVVKQDFVQQTKEIYDVRFSIKTENPIKIKSNSEMVFKYLRYKHKKTFLFENEGFKIDFIVAWKAENDDQLQEYLSQTECKFKTFEVELEILPLFIQNINSKNLVQRIQSMLGFGELSFCSILPALECNKIV